MRRLVTELRAVLEFVGTSTWTGFQIPAPNLLKTNPEGAKPVSRSAMAPKGGFGFHTETAQKVWEKCRRLILKHPESGPDQILALAIAALKVSPFDLTPEDERLLSMAINWEQNGPAGQKATIHGVSQGPFPVN